MPIGVDVIRNPAETASKPRLEHVTSQNKPSPKSQENEGGGKEADEYSGGTKANYLRLCLEVRLRYVRSPVQTRFPTGLADTKNSKRPLSISCDVPEGADA